MTKYIVQMGMDEFEVDYDDFSELLGPHEGEFWSLIRVKCLDGVTRWVNPYQIKMIEER